MSSTAAAAAAPVASATARSRLRQASNCSPLARAAHLSTAPALLASSQALAPPTAVMVTPLPAYAAATAAAAAAGPAAAASAIALSALAHLQVAAGHLTAVLPEVLLEAPALAPAQVAAPVACGHLEASWAWLASAGTAPASSGGPRGPASALPDRAARTEPWLRWVTAQNPGRENAGVARVPNAWSQTGKTWVCDL